MPLIVRTPFRFTYLVLTLSLLLAGDAWRMGLSWWTFGVLAVLVSISAIVMLVRNRSDWKPTSLPYPLLALLALATVSIAWSAYPAATVLGLATTWMTAIASLAIALFFTWRELLNALGLVLRIVLGLSLLFELFVSLVIRAPILPLFAQPGVDYSEYDKLPKMLYWSRNELFQVFDEGRIQGIVGNANNLGILALLALIVFSLQLADGITRKRTTIPWIAIAALVLLFTRSGTVTVALIAVTVVAVAVLLLRRARTPRSRAMTYAAIAVMLAVAATGVLVLRSQLLAVLGKSADLTGRVGIWDAVIALAQQRPAFGWGWVSYWVPWAAPFDTLAFRNGVRQLQAHNVWIDVWFQLGVVGLVVFAALVLSTFSRTWSIAVDPPQTHREGPGSFSATTLLPVLVLTPLLVQSVAESRLLVEFGLMFLIVFAVRSKRGDLPEPLR